jgi:glutamate racemase
LKHYLDPLIKAGIDTVVLGCTHYPFIQHHIRAIAGKQVTIIETARPVTLQLINRLTQLNLATEKKHQGKLICFSSHAPPIQQKVISKLLNTNISVKSLY